MSRVAKANITVPGNVQVTVNSSEIAFKGPKGSLTKTLILLLKSFMMIRVKLSLLNQLILIQKGGLKQVLQEQNHKIC